jgi:hypothetical protein
MSKHLPLPTKTLREWQIWLKDQLIADVPPEDAFCEFDCEKSECEFDHWNNCKRRLAYLELVKAHAATQPTALRV